MPNKLLRHSSTTQSPTVVYSLAKIVPPAYLAKHSRPAAVAVCIVAKLGACANTAKEERQGGDMPIYLCALRRKNKSPLVSEFSKS